MIIFRKESATYPGTRQLCRIFWCRNNVLQRLLMYHLLTLMAFFDVLPFVLQILQTKNICHSNVIKWNKNHLK